jgi:hypothetical protein
VRSKARSVTITPPITSVTTLLPAEAQVRPRHLGQTLDDANISDQVIQSSRSQNRSYQFTPWELLLDSDTDGAEVANEDINDAADESRNTEPYVSFSYNQRRHC